MTEQELQKAEQTVRVLEESRSRLIGEVNANQRLLRETNVALRSARARVARLRRDLERPA